MANASQRNTTHESGGTPNPDPSALVRQLANGKPELDDLLAGIVATSSTGMLAMRAVRNSAGKIIDFEYILANPAALRVMQRTWEEVAGRSVGEVFPHVHEIGLIQTYAAVVETGVPARLERMAVEAPVRWYEVSAFKLGDGISVHFQDITPRKLSEADLRKSEASFRQMADAFHHVIWMENRDSRTVEYVNPAFERVFGVSRETLLQDVFAWNKMVHPDDRQVTAEQIKQQTEIPNWTHFSVQYRIIRPDGEIRHLLDTSVPVRDEAGNVVRMVGVAEDITERIEHERLLSESEERLELAIKGAGLGVWDWDMQADRRTYNDQWAEMLGYSLDELYGITDPYNELLHPDDFEYAQEEFRRHVVGSLPVYEAEIRLRRKDGDYLWVLDRGRVVQRDAEGRPLRAAGTHLDIDALKRLQIAQQELSVLRERQRQLVENTDQVEFHVSLDGAITHVSPVIQRVYGHEPNDVIGTLVSDLQQPHGDPRVDELFRRVMTEGGVHRAETRIQDSFGNWRWVLVSMSPICNLDGEVILCGGLIANISARKEAEAASEELRQQLQQAQKMEALGRMVGGVAHDFNNLLMPILGRAEQLLRGFPKDSDEAAAARMIRDAAGRAGGMTRQLLAFSRKQVMQLEPVVLGNVVSSFEPILSSLAGEEIRIVTELPSDGCVIRADTGQIQQVLMNLITNARDAMPSGGTVMVSVHPAAADSVPDRPQGLDREWVCLSVSDTGMGIPRDALQQIFDPFYTTKERERGTGLGLSTVYGIVVQHGGRIDVESRSREGTTFRLYFPSAGDGVAPTSESTVGSARKEAVADTRRACILVVEDDAMVRELVEDALSEAGHRVSTAESPEEALELVANADTELDLVVTDIVMPGMRGNELWARIAASRPGIRAIYMSGYADDMVLSEGDLAGPERVRFLQKPFAINDLLRAVSDALAD